MMSVLAILISLFLLMYLAYRGLSVLILAPALALLAVILSADTPVLASYTEVFMKGFAGFAKSFFPLFLLGALFGKLIEVSGSARSIAQFIQKTLGAERALLAVVLSCAFLTYGGVSLFVVAFAVYPVAVALFRQAEIPKRLIPGAIALGSFTFTMTALPGSPQIQNSIPMPYFGTDIYAAPVIGIISAILMFGLGYSWLASRARSAKKNAQGYEHSLDQGQKNKSESLTTTAHVPRLDLALLPILTVVLLNFYLSKFYLPQQDFSFLKSEPYLTSIEKVIGLWSLIVSLIAGCLIALLLNYKSLKNPMEMINEGANSSMLAILNTASEVGYGSVIASLAGFVLIKDSILSLSSNPLIAESISISVLAGITGSASGGLSIALGALGPTYLEMAQAAQISPEVLHRIATIACGGLDSLPHNGAVITLLSICGLTHKQSYLDVGITTVVVPLLTLACAITLAGFGLV
jgi:H+/gluconate symporter-like permease